jgi:hypothetical protein
LVLKALKKRIVGSRQWGLCLGGRGHCQYGIGTLVLEFLSSKTDVPSSIIPK